VSEVPDTPSTQRLKGGESDLGMAPPWEVPEEWKSVRLGQAADVSAGGSAPQGDHFFKGNRPFVRVQHLDEELHAILRWDLITDEAVGQYGLRLFPKGTIVFPKSGASIRLEKRARLPVDAYVVSHLCALQPNPHVIDGYFLFFLLRTMRLAEKKAEGYPTLSLTEIKAVPIPLPPLDEQRRIAHVLSTIQRAMEAQEKVIAAARELKRSLMKHLFTYGPVPVSEASRVPLKETEIGLVPEHWDVVPLKQVVEPTKQTDPRKNPASRFRYVDVSGISNEALTITGYADYEGKLAPSRARKLMKSGDTIFATVRPYLRRIARVPPELDGQICSTAFCVIRCKGDVAEPEFIFQAVTTDSFVGRVTGHQRGSSYPAVTDKQVLGELIALPPLAEQEQIAQSLRALDDRIKAEEKRKAALQALFKTMLHHLMTGKIRVPEAVTSDNCQAPTYGV
jgi:type I restriction enzyme S subunit